MNQYQTQAFVLRKELLSERDNVYHFYTKNFGKLHLIAKGSRDILAKLSGHLEPPALVDLMFVLENTPRLISTLEIEPYLNIKQSEHALTLAFRINSLIDDLTILNQKDEDIFQLLNDILFFINNNYQRDLLILDFSWLYFEAQLLKILGYAPPINNCVECGNNNTTHFSLRLRGSVCEKHSKKEDIPLTMSQKQDLKLLFDAPLNKFSSLKVIKEILKNKKTLELILDQFTLIIKSDIV
ncbi:MAG: DNA repair protein RecO [Minisyncoccia bacterium]|jgi:DNA repair protein RecO (recombination protein O)